MGPEDVVPHIDSGNIGVIMMFLGIIQCLVSLHIGSEGGLMMGMALLAFGWALIETFVGVVVDRGIR